MEQKQRGNGPLPEDARLELKRCGVGNALFQDELHAYKRMFNEDEKMDESYKILLVCLFMQEKQFAVPQTKKQNGKLNEPLLPVLRSNRSEQLLRRGQGLKGEDNGVREDVGPGLKEGVEMPNKRKGKGLLIHYVDVNIRGVVGKNQNRKDHVTEHEDDVHEDPEQPLRDCFVDRENGVKAFELEKKRKGEDLFNEHDDQLLRANSVKSLTEMFEPREKQNEKAQQEERSDDQPLRANSVKPYDTKEATKEEDDYGYNLFLKLMDEYKQATVKNEGVGSNKDNEPELERKSTTTVQPNVELPIQVPSPVKRSNVGNLTNDESEKAEIEKCSARQSRKSVLEEPSDKGEDENMEIGKRLSRRLRKVVYKEPSDEDEREEIEKLPFCEVGKNRKGEKVKADIEKCSSRRSRKVTYKGLSDQDEDGGEEIEKCPNDFMKNRKAKNEKAGIEKCSSRRSRKIAYNDSLSSEDNEDERETKKHSSREVRNVVMKKSENEKTAAEIEKHPSHRSKKVFYEEHSSGKDEDEEIEKRSSREVKNNVVMKKSKKAEAEIEKPSSRRSREVFYKDYSSNDEREEIEKRSSRKIKNVVLKKPKNEKAEDEIKKHPSHRSKKVFYKEHSSGNDEDEREEIEKRSSREVRNNVVMKKSKKATAEIEKLLSRRSRGVSCKEYSSSENSDVEIKKHASRRLWKDILAELSDKEKDVYMEIERRSSRKVRNVAMKKHKNEKVKDEIEKRSSHQSRKVCLPNESTNEIEILLAELDRKVAMKRLRDEEIEEKIESLRNYLLKRSRYGIEGRTSHSFRVGESSSHPKKTYKDSLEDEDSSDDDSELEILDKDECLNGPFVIAKSFIDVDNDCYKSSEECMEFRGKVLEVISKPYDKSEYKALCAQFREQCYPAHHPDLVDKLKMNRWRPRKRLAILRGYFFWLQNLTQKGSFKPWNDSVCLDVEPERPLQTRQTPGK